MSNIPKIDDWLDENFIKKNNLIGWNESITNLHNSRDAQNNQSKSYRRLVFDELCANFLAISENRNRIKKNKIPKKFSKEYEEFITSKLPFTLTASQKKVLRK